MPTVKITKNGSVTLPAHFRKALGLDHGDYVNAELVGGQIVFRPAKVIDAEDAWFHTKQWQAGETEVDREIADGELIGPFNNVADFLKKLKKK